MTTRKPGGQKTAKRRTRTRRKADTKAALQDPVALAEAVALTGLSERTLRRYMTAGRLAKRRDGRRVLLERAEVLELAGSLGRRGPVTDSSPPRGGHDGGHMADTGESVAVVSQVLLEEVQALRRQNEGLHGLVMELQGRLDEGRKLLTAGEAEASRETAELREELTRQREALTERETGLERRLELARMGYRWALALAAVAAAAAVAFALRGGL